MILLIVIAIVVGVLIYYVLHLDFELGTGFTEKKKDIREAEYRVVDKEDNDSSSENKLLKE